MREDLLPLPLPVKDSDRERAEFILRECGLQGDGIVIALNVNASEVADQRRWGVEKYAELARRLKEHYRAELVFIGAPGEQRRVSEAVTMCGGGINLAGKTTLIQVAAALENADLFITNDSGPMHLAMAMGTPTVALFGPETPRRYGPVSDRHIAVYKNYSCSPCINFAKAKKIRCKHNTKCIRDITVEEVFEAAEKILNRKPDSG